MLGLTVDNSAERIVGQRSAADWHILIGVLGLLFAVLVHAIVLTYFMGTGRWIEETSHVYKLGDEPFRKHQKLKYRTLGPMMLGIVALIMIIPTGASADPAASRQPIVDETLEPASEANQGSAQTGSSTFHFVYVVIALCANVGINMLEFRSLESNGDIVNGILDDVRRIRTEKGLPV